MRLRPAEVGSGGAPTASSIVAEMSSVETTRSQRVPAGSDCGSALSPAQARIAGTLTECS